MAKDKEDDKLSEDTIANLEQVKKGKARKFILICKGTSVVSLVVYKKGSVDKFKKEAKEAGKGQIYAGIIDGRGIDIHFKLSSAECKEAPVKPLIMKSFLEEKADFKCKPVFDILDEIGVALDEDDPEVVRFIKLQEPALEACEAHPERAEEINQLCLSIGKLFDAGSREEAIAKLGELERLVGSLNAPPPPPPPPLPPKKPEAVAPPKPGPEGELDTLLKRVRPEVEVLVKSGADKSGLAAALAKVDELKGASDFSAALEAANNLLAKFAEVYAERLGEIEPRVEKLLSGSFTERAGDVEKIKTVFGFAKERADTERFGSAIVALTNVDKLLKVAETEGAPKESDVIKEGTVAERKKFVESRWQAVIGAMHLEVDKLRPAIAMENPDEEDPNALPDEINAYLDDFCDEFNDAILGIRKADDDNRKPIELALDAIRSFRARIAGEEMIQHLGDASSDLGVDVDVAGALNEALDDIEAQLV